MILVIALATWLVFGSATAFNAKSKYLYIREGRNNKDSLLSILKRGDYMGNTKTFSLLADRLDMWSRLKPGKYEVKKGASALSLVRMLRNNRQSPVNLVITKLRTREDLARLIGKHFSTDSTDASLFLNSNDSLGQFGVDSFRMMTLVIPNTYTFLWNTPVRKIMAKLAEEKTKFWQKNDRLQKASNMGLTAEQVYTIGSIIEEETNKHDEKPTIASVYINRLNIGMPLGADPTIKYAVRDFSIKRVREKHYMTEPGASSPYNTYRLKGLPPGPICTPSPTTIDKVLEAAKTNYLFFVAKTDGSGYHHFSTTFEEHKQYAAQYHKKQDERGNR
ncbi:MAG: mltG [Chitinophagaceae bacterium]|nr:mltG [Chitinophagaceae bacterium]